MGMKKILTMCVIALFSCQLISCAQMNNQDAGTLTGGIAGGLIGSTVGQGGGQLAAIAVGTLAGAYIGGAVGRNMDENDRMRMEAALENNGPGEPAYWRNNRNHIDYEVVPVRNVVVHGNRYCRTYKTIARIDGRRTVVRGTACRQPNGKWRAVN